MNKSDRHQSRLDIERLRKAADRIESQQEALDDALLRLEAAAHGLRCIAIWAEFRRHDVDYDDIRQRALDTLGIIGMGK
jgi:hypothetical protein